MDELGTNPDFGSNYNFITFAELDSVLAYERARPRKHNGSWVINETPNLTLEEALNERAALNGMPPVGTRISGHGGLEWLIHDYNFIGAPTTVARYPDECEFLPFVAPLNPSERLLQFIGEVDRATSNQIVFLNTMPQIHPFDLGHGIHFTSPTDQSGLAPVYLDVEQAHETIIAHELAHLLVSYMYGTADARELKSKGDHGRKNQLDFLQSFVWDLEVNDLIEKRGFDMSLIDTDQINGMRALRDVTLLGYKPPTAREALLHSLFMAGAMLEKKRWSDETVSRGEPLLEFFQTATPDIYGLAVAFVEVISRHGYGRPLGIAAALRECIEIGFRATGDNLDYDRDLKTATAHECMSDKNPAHLPGLPVPLKLEIARTLSRHDITGIVKIWLGASASCQAMIMVEAPGWRAGPLPVNYPLVPEYMLSRVNPSNQSHRKAPLAGRTPDKFGRLPGDAGYNTCFPPGQSTMERVQSLVARANSTSGPPMPTGLPDTGFSFPPQLSASLGMNTQQTRKPKERGTGLPYSIPDNNASVGIPLPVVPNPQGNETIHRYMAGLGLSVARSRLKQYQSANPYSYADGNPVNYTDPTGLYPENQQNQPWSFYKWLVTGDPHARDIVYEKALAQVDASVTNFGKHFLQHNKDAIPYVVPTELMIFPLDKRIAWKIMGRKTPRARFVSTLPRAFHERYYIKIKLLERAGAKVPKSLIARERILRPVAEGLKTATKWFETVGEKEVFHLGGKSINFAKGSIGGAAERNVVILLYVEAGLAWWAAYDTMHDELIPIDADDL